MNKLVNGVIKCMGWKNKSSHLHFSKEHPIRCGCSWYNVAPHSARGVFLSTNYQCQVPRRSPARLGPMRAEVPCDHHGTSGCTLEAHSQGPSDEPAITHVPEGQQDGGCVPWTTNCQNFKQGRVMRKQQMGVQRAGKL